MPSTFSGNYTTTVVLNNGTQNPATVTATGIINVNSGTSFGSALYGNNAAGWVITNLGTVTETGANSFGINLIGALPSTITNGSLASTTPLISGTRQSVNIQNGLGTVTNYGTISQTGAAGYNAIFLNLGGSVHNLGTISSQGNTGNGIATNGSFSTVTNSGAITAQGTSSDGINLISGGSVINGSSASPAGFIGGVASGINTGNGSGTPSTVVNFGTISGTGSGPGSVSSTGIFLGNGGTVTNLGTVSVANASNGTGVIFAAVSVNPSQIVNGQSGSNTGLITAYHGAIADNSTSATSTITNYGTIQSTQTGPSAGSGFAAFAVQSLANSTVKNFGAILSAETGGGGAILLSAGGRITNGQSGSTAGLVAGAASGINVSGGAGTVTNYGTITGTASGAGTVNSTALFLGDGGTVTNLGTISDPFANNGEAVNIGTTAGAAIINGQSGSNLGLITAYHDGIFAGAGLLVSTVTNYGTIQSTQTASAPVTGFAGWGVLLGPPGTVKNFGIITSAQTNGGGAILLEAGGKVVNGASGFTAALLQSGGNGVSIEGGLGTVANYGTIKSVGTNSAIYLKNGGSVTNGTNTSPNAQIIATGNNSAIASAAGTSATVINFGTVSATAATGASGEAVNLGGGGTVTNYGLISGAHPGLSGTVTGYPGAINAENAPSTVKNFGTITNPNNSNGVNLLDGGLLINGSPAARAATIDAPHTVVYMGGTLSVPTAGAIGTLLNYGTIENTTTTSAAVSMVSGGTETNFGLVLSPRTGLAFSNMAGTAINYGTVISTSPLSATAGSGVYLGAGGEILDKAGATVTAVRDAVSLGKTFATSAAVYISNQGALTGNIGIGVQAVDTGNTTVVNAATITGTGGTAVYLGSGNNLVVVDPRAVFNGIVNGGTGGGTNTLEFAPGIIAASGLGTQYINFATIDVEAGSNVTLSGNNTIASGTTLNIYGVLSDPGTFVNNGVINGVVTISAGSYLDNGPTGTITALFDAVVGANLGGAPVTVTNLGTIQSTGTFSGVFLGGSGTVTNGSTSATGALITGAFGVVVEAAGTVANFGSIAATGTGNGVNLNAGGTLTNAANALISATATVNSAVFIDYGVGRLTNFGTIKNTASNAVHVARGTVVNQAGGLIQGGSAGDGVNMGSPGTGQTYVGAGTVTNYGTITSGGDRGVYFGDGGTLTNSGLISTAAASHAAVSVHNVAMSVTNSGLIQSTSNVGVYFEDGGSVTNSAGGLISGGTDGIEVLGAVGTVLNYGTVLSTTTGTSGSAIYLGDGGLVTNYGLISGARIPSATYEGVITAHNAVATVRNFGAITPTNPNNGINLDDGGTVFNAAGASISAKHIGISIGGTAGAPTLGAYGTVFNYGTIQNSGTGDGVRLLAGGAITNKGLISSGGNGIYLGGTAATSAAALLTNLGVITGNVGVAISALDTGANTIVNYGTITGTGGTAISFVGDPDTLVVEPGAAFNGAIANFGTNDVIDFVHVTATGATFANGVLTLTNNGSVVASLDLPGSFAAGQFALKSDGSGGSDIGLSAMSIAAPASATLGVGQPAGVPGVSIAESGSVAGETFTVTLSDAAGVLSATGSGVSGSGTTSLTIAGSLGQVNADLATLTDTDGTTPSDTITLTGSDSLGNTAPSQTIAVTVNGLPVIHAPATATVSQGVANAIAGLSLAESGNTSGEAFAVTVTDTSGDLAATGSGVSGSGTTSLTIIGSLSQVNGALATLTETEPAIGSDTITLTASDSFNNAAAPASVAVTSQSGIEFNTVPSWNGTSSIQPFGSSNTATYGQTFIAPADNVLDSFTFYLEGTATLQFQAQVYAWSGSLLGGSGSQGATGPALFTSAPITLTSTDGAFEPVTVDTGGVTLTPGSDYIALFTISGPNPTDYTNSSGTDVWGLISDAHVANDGGGGFNFDNNGSDFASLTGANWDDFSDFGDSAWTAVFAGAGAGVPVITAPSTATVSATQTDPIPGVSLTESGAAVGETFTVTLTDIYGDLSATGSGVSGSGTTSLTITGSLSQVDADLATLTDTEAAVGSDTITVHAGDSFGNTASPQAIAVTALSPLREDLNNDGISDLLMTNNNNGALVLDEVSNEQMTYTPLGGLGQQWEFEGIGNFLGDGKQGFLIWQAPGGAGNGSGAGALYVGEDINGTAQYTPIGSVGPEWEFGGTGAFLGQPTSDFLLYNSENGGVVVASVVNGAAQYTQIGGLGPEWRFEGTGDYLGDGNTGFLLWNSNSGGLVVGEDVNGTAQYTAIGGLGSEWQFEGTGDLLGHGQDDFLIRDSLNGALFVGEVANGTAQYTPIGGLGPEWQFLGTGNYDGASQAEFLLRNSSNDGLEIGAISNNSVTYTLVGSVGPEWNFHTNNIATVA